MASSSSTERESSPVRFRAPTVLDVAPTVLALLDVPLSKELPGHPLADAFEGGALGRTRFVEKYAALPKRAPPPATEADTEAVRKLAALGYLSGAGSGKPIPHDKEGRTAAVIPE